MTVPEVVRCFDNHFRRAIYSLAVYIADYPEQALVACIVQGWCPRYDIFLVFVSITSLTCPIDALRTKTILMEVEGGIAVSIQNYL